MAKIIFISLMLLGSLNAQLINQVQVNTSTTTAYRLRATNQGSNYYYAFRRGDGSTASDRQILVAYSNNNGVSFSEKNVTISGATNTYEPIIASTLSSIVVLYAYEDASSIQKVCIARSTDNGASFSLTSNSDEGFVYAVWTSWFSEESLSFISDNVSNYYVMTNNARRLYSSTNNGLSFTEIPKPSKMVFGGSQFGGFRMAANPSSGLWIAFDNSNDTLYVYKTINNGSTYTQRLSFNLELGLGDNSGDYDCLFNESTFNLVYHYEEVGEEKIYLRKMTSTTVDQPTLINSTFEDIFYLNFRNNSGLLGVTYNNTYLLYSSNNGLSWTTPITIGVEMGYNPEFKSFTISGNNSVTASFCILVPSTSLLNIYHTNINVSDKPVFTAVEFNSTWGYGTFQWVEYANMTNHQLQIASNIQFSNVVFDTLITQDGNNYVWVFLTRFCTPNQQYYYRVRGKNSTYTTTWSDIGSFNFIFTSVDEESSSPSKYLLRDCFPNPFNPTTKIVYDIPMQSNVLIKVYDVLGNEIATLVNEEKSAGSYQIIFDASALSNGVYLYRLQAGDYVSTKKMILMK